MFKDAPAQVAMHQMSWQPIENFGKMIDPNINIEAFRPDLFLGE